VLGTAKVMSDEDLKVAYAKRMGQEEKASARRKKFKEDRAKRAEQGGHGKVTKSRKRTCRQERTVGPPETYDPNTLLGVRRASEELDASSDASATASIGCVGVPMTPCPGRAPTAQMW